MFRLRFRLGKRYSGPPGHCHGGIIATILDEAMGKVNKLRDVVALTSEIKVNYRRPVPLHKPLRVESREVSMTGRRHVNMAEILTKTGKCWPVAKGLSSPSIPSACLAALQNRNYARTHHRRCRRPQAQAYQS